MAAWVRRPGRVHFEMPGDRVVASEVQTLNLKTAVEFPSETTKIAKMRRDEENGEIVR